MFNETTEQKLDMLLEMMREKHDHEILCHQGVGWKNLIQEVLVGTLWGSIVGYFLFRVMDYHFGEYHGAKKRSRRR